MRHFFLRDARNFPVACIASVILTNGLASDGPAEPDSTIAFCLSIHNPKDTYSRERGRTIAKARLQAYISPASKWEPFSVSPKPNVKANILAHIACNTSLHFRVREAARLKCIELDDRAKVRASIPTGGGLQDEPPIARTASAEPIAQPNHQPPDHCTSEASIAEEMGERLNTPSNYEARFYEPDSPAPDELSGTALEKVFEGHVEERERPWTFASESEDETRNEL